MAVWFRILQAKWVNTAMTGHGARMYGGRWNPPGRAAVYLAQTRSLAALEILVHAQREALLAEWVCLAVDIPDNVVETADNLPPDWRDQPVSESARVFGGLWMDERSALGLRLPSVIVPQEHSLLFNPEHPAAAGIQVSAPERFAFDPRLAVTSPPRRPAGKPS